MPKIGFDINLGFIEITVETRWLTRAWLGATIVLFLNTTAYSARIFYGALRSVPKGEIEAGKAIGMTRKQINKRIIWPTMLRLSWASYTNEAIFLLHATALFAPLAIACRLRSNLRHERDHKSQEPTRAVPGVNSQQLLLMVVRWLLGRVPALLSSQNTIRNHIW